MVDDEPLARRRLMRMLGRMPGVEVAAQAANAEDALARIGEDRPDLVLLDIRMPGLSGLELAASAAELPPVVFTTAYDQYAVEAFEVSAVDYLLKPVKRERLEAALEKVRSRKGGQDLAALQSLVSRLDESARRGEPTRLCARRSGTMRLFDASEIARIHASEKVSLFQHQGHEFVLDESLNTLEARLADEGFVRVHRAELVNLAHVRALHNVDGATSLELSDGQQAPVSRRMVTSLKARLGIR